MAKPRIPLPSLSKVSRSSHLPRNNRLYHSYEHTSPSPFSPSTSAILSSALIHVPTHGFTPTALTLGAADVGYPPVSTNLFPRGAFDLVNYYLVTERLALKDRLQQRFPGAAGADERGQRQEAEAWRNLGVGAKVKLLALERLWANKGVIHRWQEALALMAHLPHIRPSLHELSLLSDEIWFLAGDTSVDTSWYTKRASLAAVYSSAELFMTQDTSRDFVETEAFLDRRLTDVRRVGIGLGAVGQWVGFTGMGVLNGLSKGVRI